MTRVLFVCTGNTCRSPMAAGILRQLSAGRIDAVSAGLAAVSGARASPEAAQVMAERGVDLTDHRARPFSRELAEAADLVITMTAAQKDLVLAWEPGLRGKVRTLAEAAGRGGEVSDPYGGDLEAYRRCAAELAQAVGGLVRRLGEEEERP